MLTRLRTACLTLFLFVIPISAAYAQDKSVDFTPLLNEVAWPIIGALAAVLATWLAAKLAGWLGLKKDDEVRRYLDQALHAAVNYGLSTAREKWLKEKTITVDINNDLVRLAANYAIKSVPDALAKFEITPERLAEMVRARLYQWSGLDEMVTKTADEAAAEKAALPTASEVAGR